MSETDARFFFALSRLVQWWRGRNANRSEKNGREAKFVGALIHLVVYAFAFHLLLADRPLAGQLLWAIPLAFLVWLFWLNLIYLNCLAIRLLRAGGLMRHLPQTRAQGILIGLVTTLFALRLIDSSGWTYVVALVWLAAVVLNLLAAGLLAISR